MIHFYYLGLYNTYKFTLKFNIHFYAVELIVLFSLTERIMLLSGFQEINSRCASKDGWVREGRMRTNTVIFIAIPYHIITPFNDMHLNVHGFSNQLINVQFKRRYFDGRKELMNTLPLLVGFAFCLTLWSEWTATHEALDKANDSTILDLKDNS